MRVEILNVAIDNVTRSEALARLSEFLREDRNHLLCTPNPEMIMSAQSDADLMEALRGANLVVPDGIGVVIASRLKRKPLKERVAGCDLVYALFDKLKDSGHTVYMLGGKPGVAGAAAENMRKKFPGLKIIGSRHGYFKPEEEHIILEEIKRLKPDILLAGLGAGRQEKWLWRNRGLPCRLSAGVGGSLDVMSGTVKRAPIVFQRLGLEWFYRLLHQPSRAGRMLSLPLFMIRVITDRG